MTSNYRTHAARTVLPRRALVMTAAALTLLGFVLVHTSVGKSAGNRIVISTSTTKLGKILVESQEQTLYLFGKDPSGKSACAGQCATFWPPLIADGNARVAGGANASLIGTIKRADGRRQLTYNHHPLYTFLKDKKKGMTSGEGVNAFGAKWYAVSPAGARVLPKAGAMVVPKPAGNGIPQNNGGDQDADNNGGPSDGDGNM